MRLLIVRHAIAVPQGTPGVPDEERPLTGRGKRRFRRAARGLARVADRPHFLLMSPLTRAAQTARIAAKAWGRLEPREAPSLADTDPEAVLAAAVDAASESGHGQDATVALVGHEPGVSALVAHLIGGARAAGLEFRKGGAALVEVDDATTGGGRLIWYLPPRVLRALGQE